jgi:8-oxo-dGTP pyrophosphatase MutT (NUDIX family)
MYKVFFNDSFLVITDKHYQPLKHLHTFQLQSFNQIEKWILEAENSVNPVQLICLTENPHDVWLKLQSLFRIIEAAGGLVKNDDKKYLFIFRRGKWDLPKGKIESGEIPSDAAIREVMEETGLKLITIKKYITSTYHIYRLKGKLVLKRTYWYLMNSHGADTLIPQIEEDIEKAIWLNPAEIEPLMLNMFGSVKDLVENVQLVKKRSINIFFQKIFPFR